MALEKQELATKIVDKVIEELKDGNYMYYHAHFDAYKNLHKEYPIDDEDGIDYKKYLDRLVEKILIEAESNNGTI